MQVEDSVVHEKKELCIYMPEKNTFSSFVWVQFVWRFKLNFLLNTETSKLNKKREKLVWKTDIANGGGSAYLSIVDMEITENT